MMQGNLMSLKTPDTLKATYGDYIFVDDTEITNFEWGQFVISSGRIDSTKFPKDNPNFKQFMLLTYDTLHHTFTLPFFKESQTLSEMPVFGISYDQAVAFCQWRTESDKISALLNNFDNSFYYELPSPEMFRLICYPLVVASRYDLIAKNYIGLR